MTLYAVRIERTIIVDAASEEDALLDAQEAEAREAENEPDYIGIDPITSVNQVPEAWRNARPYGRDDNLTCEQILK